MTGTYIFAAIALVTGGAVIGVLAVVALGIRRDDRRGAFPARADGRVARGAELPAHASRRQDVLPV